MHSLNSLIGRVTERVQVLHVVRLNIVGKEGFVIVQNGINIDIANKEGSCHECVDSSFFWINTILHHSKLYLMDYTKACLYVHP